MNIILDKFRKKILMVSWLNVKLKNDKSITQLLLVLDTTYSNKKYIYFYSKQHFNII